MKVCPKCNSTYTDETLNFCLTDGVPLVAQQILDEYLSKQNSKSWHTADTLVDPRFSAADARPTSVNPSSPTLELGNHTAQSLSVGRTGKAFYLVAGVALAAALGGGLWWFAGRGGDERRAASETVPAVPKHAVVALSPEQDAQVRREIADFMREWARTNEQKNPDAHLAHYAGTLEVYYGESGKDRNHVLADRLRAWQKYDTVQMQVDNLKITPESTESASVVFDKSWTMKNDKKTSTGSVQQEIHVSRTNGRWLIDSEKDLKVYFINNRENQTAAPENSNAAPPAPAG